MEEDAGKSLHEGFADSDRKTYVDFNRSGVPLIEIVTEPDLRSAADAAEFFTRLRAHARLARRQRRQHGRGQPALRRERVGPPARDRRRSARRRKSRTSTRSASCRRRSNTRSSARSTRVERRRTRRAGNAPVGRRRRPDRVDAQQGRSARLPLFSRARSAAGRRRCRAPRSGSRRRCRSCPTRGAAGSSSSTRCPSTTPAS